jgi:hypothetical protein
MPRPPRPVNSPRHAVTRTPEPSDEQVYTPGEAAELLKVRESWLRRKAAARLVACTSIGKHLRFTSADIAAIIAAGANPATGRKPRRRSPTPRQRGDLPTPPDRNVHAHHNDPDPNGSSRRWYG